MSVEPVDESTPESDEQELTAILGEKAETLPLEDQAKLSRLDPFRRYLLEISQFEPLGPEEERRLALRYRENEDQDAAYRLVTSNLRLVVKVAMIYRSVYFNVMDLIQEGNIGLIEAMKRFDPYKGARLPTYASWWIKAYIIKFILDNFRIVRVGTTNERRKLLFNLRKEKFSPLGDKPVRTAWPGGRTSAGAPLSRERRSGRRLPSCYLEFATRRQSRDDLPQCLFQRHGFDPRGEYRTDRGDETIRSLQGGAPADVCLMVDQGLHHQIHPRQFPDRARGHHQREAKTSF